MQIETSQQLIQQLTQAIREGTKASVSWLSYIPAVSAAISSISAVITVSLFYKAQANTRKLEDLRYQRTIMPTLFFLPSGGDTFALENVTKQAAANIVIQQYKVILDSNEPTAKSAFIFKKGAHVLVETSGPSQITQSTGLSIKLHKDARLLIAKYSNLYDDDAYATAFDMRYRRNIFKHLGPKEPGEEISYEVPST